MDYYPDFSDVSASPETIRSWESEWTTRQKYAEYYNGLVFERTITNDDGQEIEEFPVGLNLCKVLCLSQADTLFGEWDEDIVRFEPPQDSDVGNSEQLAVELAQKILRTSSANTHLWEIALDREIFGGGVLRISPGDAKTGFIRWSRVPLDHFWPVWDPENIDRLLEVYIIYEITREQAKGKYGYDTKEDMVRCIEHWDLHTHSFQLDDTVIPKYSGINPWGVIPFEYIPRYRSFHWWGDSGVEDIMRPQDELNARVADLGEAINYNSHPVRWGRNLKRPFNEEGFPLAPNVLWDLSSQMGKDSPLPEVGILEASKPVPQEAFTYVSFLYDWTRTTSFAPPVTFGEDANGAQRSGITVELRMWPLIKATRRSRSYMISGLARAMHTSAIILAQRQFTGVSSRAIKSLVDLTPRMAPIMPRDQAATIDEILKGMSTNPPVVSNLTASKKLGYGTGEVKRVEDMINSPLYKKLKEMNEPEKEEKLPGKDSATGAAPDKSEDDE